MRALVFLAGASTRRSMASEFAVSPEVIDSEVLKSYKGLAAKFFDIWLESVQFRARCSGDYLQKPKWARYTISATRPQSALQTLPLLRGKQASSLVQIRSNSLQYRFRHKSISVRVQILRVLRQFCETVFRSFELLLRNAPIRRRLHIYRAWQIDSRGWKKRKRPCRRKIHHPDRTEACFQLWR
jgi:hypothetical protein